MIYSIGHGNKTLEQFLAEIKSFDIRYLIDVRSSPYSRMFPQFNREGLSYQLEEAGITYVYMGDSLGGLPADSSCFTDGKVDYDLIKEKEFFKEGLNRLLTANEKNIHIALMCSESKPQECHRSKLIGQELLKKDIGVLHIVAAGRTKSQITVMNELNKGKNFVDLFNEEVSFTSRKKYE